MSDPEMRVQAALESAAGAYCMAVGMTLRWGAHFGGKYYFIAKGPNIIYVAHIDTNRTGGVARTSITVEDADQARTTVVHGLIEAALRSPQEVVDE